MAKLAVTWSWQVGDLPHGEVMYDLIRAFYYQQWMQDLLGRIGSGRSAAAYYGARVFVGDVASNTSRDGETLSGHRVRQSRGGTKRRAGGSVYDRADGRRCGGGAGRGRDRESPRLWNFDGRNDRAGIG